MSCVTSHGTGRSLRSNLAAALLPAGIEVDDLRSSLAAVKAQRREDEAKFVTLRAQYDAFRAKANADLMATRERLDRAARDRKVPRFWRLSGWRKSGEAPRFRTHAHTHTHLQVFERRAGSAEALARRQHDTLMKGLAESGQAASQRNRSFDRSADKEAGHSPRSDGY